MQSFLEAGLLHKANIRVQPPLLYAMWCSTEKVGVGGKHDAIVAFVR